MSAGQPSVGNAAPFVAARDFLLQHRQDYATAYRDFRWPKLDRFNWALDYFDVDGARQCRIRRCGSSTRMPARPSCRLRR